MLPRRCFHAGRPWFHRVALGFGRLQDVRFAEKALFLLDRIAAVTGREIRLSREDIQALEAHLEVRRKLRPFYDFRLATVYDLESFDLFVRERAGLGVLPARAVLEMADEWDHAGRHRRESGWEARIYPFFTWSWEDREERGLADRYARMLPVDSRPMGNPCGRIAGIRLFQPAGRPGAAPSGRSGRAARPWPWLSGGPGAGSSNGMREAMAAGPWPPTSRGLPSWMPGPRPRLRLDTEYFLGHRISLRASATTALDWSRSAGEFPGYFPPGPGTPYPEKRRGYSAHVQGDLGVVYYLF